MSEPSSTLLKPIPEIFAGKKVLLTGATGFLGKVYLCSLLKHCPDVGQVVCLLRADSQQGAQDRFLRDVIASPALDPLRDEHGVGLRDWVLERATPLRADLSLPLAGLEGEALETATRDVDLVIHCAGLVEFVPALDKALFANVDGTLNCLELAKLAGPGRAAFVHVSTAFVCGDRPGQHQEELIVDGFPKRHETGFDGFDAEVELKIVRRLIERIRSEENDDPAVRAEVFEEAGGSKRRMRRMLDVRVRRRLVEAGLERAAKWGWTNTYTYTKALAERLVELRGTGIGASALVRPAVVESSIGFPFPGWNQGINTSAPLVWMSSQGTRYWPTTNDTFLDVIPVDYVVHALVAVGAAALQGQCEPVYQLGTSDSNPFAMRRVIELASLAYRESPDKAESLMMRFVRRHLEGTATSNAVYERLGIPAQLRLAKQLEGALDKVPEPEGRPRLSSLLGRVKETVKTAARELERGSQVVQVYLPFIANCPVSFRTDNMRRLFRRLTPADQERFPFRPETIDWRHYWMDVHIPGLERWAFPQLRLQAGTGPATDFEQEFTTLTGFFEDRARFGRVPLWRRLDGEGNIATRVTYADAVKRAQAAASRLLQLGVRPHDRVVLLSENCPEWGLGYFGVLFCGATATPLESEITSERAANLIRASGAGIVLISAWCEQQIGDELRAALGDTEIRVELLEDLVRPRERKEDLPELPLDQELVPRAPASLIYTSGTTGAPKGVLLSHQAFCKQVRALASMFRVSSEDRILSVLPLHHCFEFSAGFLMPMLGGASSTYLDETTPEAVRRGLETVKPTLMIGVPALFDAWYRKVRRQVRARGPRAERAYEALIAFHRSFRARTGLNLGPRLFAEIHEAFGGELKYTVCGGAALSRDVAMEFEGLGLDIFQGYGMTEAAPVICAQRPDEPLIAGSVGPAIPGVQVKIHEPDGEGVGEIVARSPSLFLGYDGKEQETRNTLRDGWLHTGDLGRLDEAGHMHVVGRLKDAIVDASGNTVHPDEVEDLYEGCDDVAELAVASVTKGEHDVVGALVVAKTDVEGGVESARERVREFFRARGETLPYPKRIKVLQFTPRALPRTPTRKVKRQDVSRMLLERSRLASERGTKRRQRQAEAGLTRVAQVFQDVAGVESSLVLPEASLSQDLGLDSIALAEVVLALAEEFERPAPRSLVDVDTVRDLLSLLDQNGGTASARPLEADPRPIHLPEPVRTGISELLNSFQRVGYGKLLDCTVTGRGNIPHHTNCIVVANHASHLDVGLVKHALGSYGDQLVSAGARDYFFKDTLTATYFDNFTNVVAFDRMASVRESLERFVELVRQGKTVLIFPEGTRSVTGRLGAFKPGLGLIVQAAKIGVLPVYLSGTHHAMPKGTWLPRTDQPLEARIGPYLSPEQMLGLTADLGRRQQATTIVAAVRQALCALRDGETFDLAGALQRDDDRRNDGRGTRKRARLREAAEQAEAADSPEAELTPEGSETSGS